MGINFVILADGLLNITTFFLYFCLEKIQFENI